MATVQAPGPQSRPRLNTRVVDLASLRACLCMGQPGEVDAERAVAIPAAAEPAAAPAVGATKSTPAGLDPGKATPARGCTPNDNARRALPVPTCGSPSHEQQYHHHHHHQRCNDVAPVSCNPCGPPLQQRLPRPSRQPLSANHSHHPHPDDTAGSRSCADASNHTPHRTNTTGGVMPARPSPPVVVRSAPVLGLSDQGLPGDRAAVDVSLSSAGADAASTAAAAGGGGGGASGSCPGADGSVHAGGSNYKAFGDASAATCGAAGAPGSVGIRLATAPGNLEPRASNSLQEALQQPQPRQPPRQCTPAVRTVRPSQLRVQRPPTQRWVSGAAPACLHLLRNSSIGAKAPQDGRRAHSPDLESTTWLENASGGQASPSYRILVELMQSQPEAQPWPHLPEDDEEEEVAGAGIEDDLAGEEEEEDEADCGLLDTQLAQEAANRTAAWVATTSTFPTSAFIAARSPDLDSIDEGEDVYGRGYAYAMNLAAKVKVLAEEDELDAAAAVERKDATQDESAGCDVLAELSTARDSGNSPQVCCVGGSARAAGRSATASPGGWKGLLHVQSPAAAAAGADHQPNTLRRACTERFMQSASNRNIRLAVAVASASNGGVPGAGGGADGPVCLSSPGGAAASVLLSQGLLLSAALRLSEGQAAAGVAVQRRQELLHSASPTPQPRAQRAPQLPPTPQQRHYHQLQQQQQQYQVQGQRRRTTGGRARTSTGMATPAAAAAVAMMTTAPSFAAAMLADAARNRTAPALRFSGGQQAQPRIWAC